MASFERMNNGNISAHLTEEEARVVQALAARVGGVGDTSQRRASERVLEGLDELLGMGDGGAFFGSIVAVDTPMHDLPEGRERDQAFAVTTEIEHALFAVAHRLGMVNEA